MDLGLQHYAPGSSARPALITAASPNAAVMFEMERLPPIVFTFPRQPWPFGDPMRHGCDQVLTTAKYHGGAEKALTRRGSKAGKLRIQNEFGLF